MKRYPLVLLGIFCPLLFALRLFQMYFCIDAEGFFLKETSAQILASYSLYIVLVIAGALLLFICLPTFCYGSVTQEQFLSRAESRVICFFLAVAVTVESVARFYSCFAFWRFDWVVPFGLLAAIGFLMLGLGKWERLWWGALFPIAYASVRVASYFFASFKYIRASETVFDVLQMALMVLLFLEFARHILGLDPNGGRLRFLSVGYIFLATVTVAARVAALALGITSVDSGITYVTMTVDFFVGVLAAIFFHKTPIGKHTQNG